MKIVNSRRYQGAIIHQISLSGLGGVQQSFVDYYRLARKESSFRHAAFGNFELDQHFGSVEDYYNINKSIICKARFLAALCSSKNIIHFYNNLGSPAVRRLLRVLPITSYLFHERGVAWNVPVDQGQIVRDNTAKARIILANSRATKILLIKKFGVPEEKIQVIYNGIQYVKPLETKLPPNHDRPLVIGYIGRLDTPKGVHILIETARLLGTRHKVVFLIAGSGPLEDMLRHQAKEIENVSFVGAVSNPYEFLAQVDIVVVPSIREPFGNVIVEAGYMHKAVIASNVDGIPEIIENQMNGILIDSTLPIKNFILPNKAAPYPEVVVNPKTENLVAPREMDPEALAEMIKTLINNPDRCRNLGDRLNETVISRFNLNRYYQELENIYLQMGRYQQ